MTRKELASQLKGYEKWNRKSSLLLLPVMLVGTFLLAWISGIVTEEFKIPVAVSLTGWLLGYGYISTRLQNKKLRALNLYCPTCDAKLAAVAGRVVIATLYCGNCGNKILEEDQDFEMPLIGIDKK